MRVQVYNRSLVPSHLYCSRVLAWQCSVCGKIFSQSLEEAGQQSGIAAPEHIENEFRMHSCEVVLVTQYEKADARRRHGRPSPSD